MRSNSRTITDLDSQLSRNSPSSQYKIEQKIENETKISNSQCNRSFDGTNQMLFEVTSYQVSIFDFFLLFA